MEGRTEDEPAGGAACGRAAAGAPRLGLGFALGALAALLARDLGLPSLISFPHDYLLLTLGLVPAGMVAWLTRARPLLVALTGALALTWCSVAFTPLSAWLARDLARRDPLEVADAVFVLSSRLQRDGEPTTVASDRLVHGIELIGQGLAPRLVLSELGSPSGSYAAYARALMSRLGLEPEVLTVGPVRNTHDEAVAVAALCRERSWTTVLAVTSPYHSRRASAALEHEGLRVVASPAVETRFDLQSLERPSERLEAFGALIHERLGIWVYARRGWIGTQPGCGPADE